MNATTLVSTAALAEQIASADPRLVIVDCRFALEDVGWGERAYREGHIPGARYAHLDRDLSGETSGRNGRHPLPAPPALERTLSALGVDRTTQVVAYDQDAGMFASRLWWLLRWAGHSRVAVLDGGFAKWTRESRAISAGIEPPASAAAFVGRFDDSLRVDASTVEQLLNQPSDVLVDARAEERFRGEIEPIDAVAGHIPGAVNHPYKTNVDEAGVFLSPEALRESFQRSLAGRPPERAVCTAGQRHGVSEPAGNGYAGLPGGRLYPVPGRGSDPLIP
jgi:thiosulfate/3-mercaptopyruvate sulfurtransferase